MDVYAVLEKALKKNPNFVSDNGELKKWVVLNYAQHYDYKLITLLLDNEILKARFFIELKEALVFNQFEFIRFLEQVNGAANEEYLKEQDEVVLTWPFKDCVLEGGQSKGENGREEIFFNEILAKDEISQLFEPKVLTDAKRYTINGVQDFTKFNRNESGTISDNLIIKGNNLLTLHSLKEEFAGKIKLIYIDPPYNTGSTNGTIIYNNNFKRSSWLTFMYNRLQVAKELLSEDGVLIVAIDKNEQPYLGVLLKEYFTAYDVHCITIVHNPRGVQGTNFSYTHEYAFFVVPKDKKLIGNRIIEAAEIKWIQLRNWGGASLRSDARNCFFPIIVNAATSEIEGFGEVCADEFHPAQRQVSVKDKIYIYPVDNDGIERKWRYARQTIETVKTLLRARIKTGQWDVELGKNFGQYKTVWIDPKYDANEYGTKIVNKLVPAAKFSFPKSLYNVKDCIYAVVGADKDAIVLDYFAGSGTTAHAVLELNKEDGGNRRFILCEQMDYIETVTAPRVAKVMENNNSGDFVYLALKKYNEHFIDTIKAAKNSKAVLKIWETIKAKSFLNYNVDLESQEIQINQFKTLTLAEQKRYLIALLAKNQLYINCSAIKNDKDLVISVEEEQLTKDFYQL